MIADGGNGQDDPANVDAGVYVLHWLDAGLWEGDFSE